MAGSRNCFLSFLFAFYSLTCFSQSGKIDSLLSLLKTDKEDTGKVVHLNQLSWEYRSIGSYDSSITFAKNALQLAQQLNPAYKKGIANAYGNLGNVKREQANYPQALDNYLKALKVDEELKDKSGMAKRLGNIGIVYDDQGDYDKSLDYYLQALKMAEELVDKRGIAIDMGNIGTVYYEQKKFSKAIDYYLMALMTTETIGDKNLIGVWLSNLGNVYKDKADFSQQSGDTAQANQDYPKALDYSFKALKMAQDLGDKEVESNTLCNIGTIYTSMIKSASISEKEIFAAKAEQNLLQALKLDKETGSQNTERQVEEILTDLYEKTGKDKLALEHYKNAMVLKDSIFSQENKKELVRKELNYEFQKKEAETKAAQDKKDAVTRIVIYSVSAGFILVLLLAGFIFRSYRQKQKANEIISEQKLLVEEKQKEILDSIHYAKRIQQSLLPTDKYIGKNLDRLNKRE